MDPEERDEIVLPSDDLAQVMALARRQREESSDGGDEDPHPELIPVSRPITATRTSWLDKEFRELIDDVEMRPMITALLRWADSVAGPARVSAVFHTEIGRISTPVMQYVRSNNDSVLVLVLDPKRIAFYPVQGASLKFSLEFSGQGSVPPTEMTVLSGPWSMPGFPVAFLLLWDQNAAMPNEQDMVKDARDRSAPLQRMADAEDERSAVQELESIDEQED